MLQIVLEWLSFHLESHVSNIIIKITDYKVLTMVSPGCIPARMASICVGVN